ncbi:sensor histidine kinase [Vallitalea okinawensis]|uniref:sensor histidine kinase n=1 Tax=Vallitalea okinawensis TaxID=2078660 RepID=UPI00147872CF|nr:sensor histidine kinase [Vallitalea okinawensis]
MKMIYKIKELPLATKIFFFNIIIMLCSMVIFSLAGGYAFKRITIEQAKASIMKETNLITNSMELLTRSINDSIINISIDKRVQDALLSTLELPEEQRSLYTTQRTLGRAINEIIGISENIISCDFKTESGSIIHISPFLNSQVESMLNKDTFTLVTSQNSQQLQWYAPHHMMDMAGTSKSLFIVKKPVYHLYNAKYLGAVFMYIDEDTFSNIFSSNFDDENSKFYIIGSNEEIISATDNQIIGKSIVDVIGIEKLTFHKFQANEEAVIQTKNQSYYLAIEKIPNSDWYLLSQVSMDTLLTSYQRFRAFLLYFSVIYTLIAFIISRYMSHNISKPITKLVKVMKYIKNGQRDQRADELVKGEMYLLNTTFNNLMDRNDKLFNDIVNKQEAIRNYEFLLMQAQIKPHFLYNTLGTIHSLVQLDMKEEALGAAQSLASFYRLSLSQGQDLIPIIEEKKIVESYLTIQRYRYVKILDFKIHIPARIEKQEIPKLTLQPIVENAIYHGLKPKGSRSTIHIRACVEGKVILIHVIDTGIGISPETIELLNKSIASKEVEGSFGLRSIHQRIQMIHGDAYGIQISSKQGYFTKITIRLPYEPVGEDDKC